MMDREHMTITRMLPTPPLGDAVGAAGQDGTGRRA